MAGRTAAPKAETKPDMNQVRAAEKKVGDHAEQRRQEAVAANTPVAPDPENLEFWKWLARPFPPEDQEKLPQNVKRGDDDKGPCENTPRGRKYSADGYYCGGWHARSLHLDYIGHAGITMRLNEDVGANNWDWQPVSFDDKSLPLIGREEFWIRLTILGVSKYGVGDQYRGSAKQAIGDALRNAAMRFGIGTYLWAKSEKALAMRANTEQAQEVPAAQQQEAEQAGPPPHIVALKNRLGGLRPEMQEIIRKQWSEAGLPKLESVSPEQAKVVHGLIDAAETEAAKSTLGERLGATENDPSTTEAMATNGTAADIAREQQSS